MKPFIFRLERVLQLRSKLEQQRAQALAQAVRDEQERRAALDEAAARLDRCGEQIAGTGSGGATTAGALRNLGLTVQAAVHQVRAAEDSLESAVDSVQTEQERFGQARRERRVVERLRERRRTAWGAEAAREEQRELDGMKPKKRNHGSEPQ